MSNNGMVMRMPLDQISTLGRTAQGVRLMNLKDDNVVSTISLVEKAEEIEENSAEEQVREISE